MTPEHFRMWQKRFTRFGAATFCMALLTAGMTSARQSETQAAAGGPNTITGTLFEDPNGSGGTFDSADGDIASTLGLAVHLYRDVNGDGRRDPGDPLLTSTTTDASGSYSFSGGESGSFIVELRGATPQPTTTPTAHAVDFGGRLGETDGQNDFGYESPGGHDLTPTPPVTGPPATVIPGDTVEALNTQVLALIAQNLSIGNQVFEDTNGNGVRDGGEPGIGGVEVELWQDSDGDGVIDALVPRVGKSVTRNDGSYSFSGLAEGRYVVTVPSYAFNPGRPLAGYVSSPGVGDLETDNDDDGIDPGTTGGRIITGSVALDANFGDRFDVDLGFVPPSGSIGNIVWHDQNENGILDPGEPGIPDVLVHLNEDRGLFGEFETLVEATTTDATGAYNFDRLTTGRYQVMVHWNNFQLDNAALDGFTSSEGVGELTTDNDDDGEHLLGNRFTEVTTSEIVLTDDNNNFPGVDFGFITADVDIGGGNDRVQSIGNLVFDDANFNGVRDAGEAGIAAVTLTLMEDTDHDGGYESEIATTTTDAGGGYSFDLLPNGRYKVYVRPAQFKPGAALDGFRSSHGDGYLLRDDDDDGRDPSRVGLSVGTDPIVLLDTTDGFVTVDFGFHRYGIAADPVTTTTMAATTTTTTTTATAPTTTTTTTTASAATPATTTTAANTAQGGGGNVEGDNVEQSGQLVFTGAYSTTMAILALSMISMGLAWSMMRRREDLELAVSV